MASHFQCIGFPEEQHLFFDLIDQIFSSGVRQTTSSGDYIPWNAGLGPEAWLQLDGMNVLGFVPHFSGESRVNSLITAEVTREGQSSLDSALHAWVNPVGQDPKGDFPIVFDSPDYRLRPPLIFPHLCQIQFALFPDQVALFESEEEFLQAQAARPQKYALQSLIPTGLFGEGPPRSEVFASGVVKNVSARANPLTKLSFLAVNFDTFGGCFDVPLPNKDEFKLVQPGSIIAGSFWVSGRVLRGIGPPPLPPNQG